MNRRAGLVYIPSWILVISVIVDGMSGSDVERKTGAWFSHVSHVLKDFEGRGWITRKKEGRRSCVFLTDSGLLIREHAVSLLKASSLNMNLTSEKVGE